jgi:hypothetical protein
MPVQVQDLGRCLPRETLDEITPEFLARTVAPLVSGHDGGGNGRYRGRSQAIRKIALQAFRIAHDRLRAIKQRFV